MQNLVSFIPKYIMKRMFPSDCVKKVEGGIELTMVNVISPITAKDLPENVSDFISVKVDGNEIPSEVIQSLVVTANENKYDTSNLKDLNGQTLPIGGSLTFFVPYEGVEAGEEHELALDIKETKFQFTFSRVVQ
ncbi:MAG TPA: hypothetical protein VKM55_16625 [Candidatus Lokiarchaeia archaeon]|nr:hypothetical protein [Candidatus Lokiarchaeia archaeon]